MCELLGMSANVPTDICFSFTGLIRRGGHTGPHGDGWGIAFFEGKGLRAFHDPRASANSEVTVDFASETTPNDIVSVIATEPLTTNESWTLYEPGEWKLWVDGEVVLSGISGS